jgi:hypothetical protein
MISAESKIKILEKPIKGKVYFPVGSRIEVTQIELSYWRTNLLKRILTAVKSGIPIQFYTADEKYFAENLLEELNTKGLPKSFDEK